jgi:hypothetical protein
LHNAEEGVSEFERVRGIGNGGGGVVEWGLEKMKQNPGWVIQRGRAKNEEERRNLRSKLRVRGVVRGRKSEEGGK